MWNPIYMGLIILWSAVQVRDGLPNIVIKSSTWRIKHEVLFSWLVWNPPDIWDKKSNVQGWDAQAQACSMKYLGHGVDCRIPFPPRARHRVLSPALAPPGTVTASI